MPASEVHLRKGPLVSHPVRESDFLFRSVTFNPIPDNWSELGGTEEAIAPPPVSDDQCSYWFRLKYEARCARFTAVDYEREFFNEYDPDHIGECRLCKILNVRSSWRPRPRPMMRPALRP